MERMHHSLMMSQTESLSSRLAQVHLDILERVPEVERIACALYDPSTDLVKTFINSTRQGHAITGYEYPLHNSRALSLLAQTRDCRVIDDIRADIQAGNPHSDWLLEQGYRSSYTVPMQNGDRLLGFIFFDSSEAAVFTDRVQRDLLIFCNLITMVVASEFAAVSSLLATAQAARQFVHLRDFETGAHLRRMAHYSRLIARNLLAELNLSDEFVEHVYLFAPLHDIGKIGIPDHILLKPGALTADERGIMQGHVEKGVELVDMVLSGFSLSHLVDSAIMLNIVACHHEFMDGSGYPKGLSAEQIPLEARIVTTADIFDALTSERPYKKCWSQNEAMAELRRMVGLGKLDGRCVEALAEAAEEVADIMVRLADDPV